ncbi:Hypothetical protein SSO1496 [Saccharolobus solfataricus P2]|uniref:Uncharacterized protein n=2 Tax=Saccharolobus solfataricus TaxID=2287 RepID=Q97Y50_SACS2|nr:Hypothetical protein SSO1496 [Saccharolobus solfataricus P2]SAI85171.1 uncharacterised protein [Saccharolobus solfataricus]
MGTPRYSTRYSPWGNSPTGTDLPPSLTRALDLSSPTVSFKRALELTYQESKTLHTTLNSFSSIGKVSKYSCILVLNSTSSPLTPQQPFVVYTVLLLLRRPRLPSSLLL